MIVLIVGKGGVGKSTLAQALARSLVADKQQVLLLDADADGASAIIFDAPAALTVAELKEDLKEARDRAIPDLAPLVVQTPSGVALLRVGQGEGAGCYCGPNNRLRAGLKPLMVGYDWVIVDSHAGSEFISRGVVVPDITLVVCKGGLGDPSRIVAQQIKQVLAARKVPGPQLDVVVAGPADADEVAVPALADLSAWVPADVVGRLATPVFAAIEQLHDHARLSQ